MQALYVKWLAEQAPETGCIRGYEVGKNIVVRYDPYNNDYVKAYVFTGAITRFKPDDKAIYYERLTIKSQEVGKKKIPYM